MPEAATYWERAANTRWGQYLTDVERQNLIQALDLVGADTAQAMEIGCEGGRWSRYLVGRGWSVTCTDIDPNVLSTCQARLPEVKTLLVSGDEDRFPAEDESVDFLLVYEVPAITQAAWFPAEASRVLKPNGVMAFTTHNPLSARGLAYLTLHRTGLRRRSGHFYEGPVYPKLRRSLRKHGFQMVREEGLAWFPFSRVSDSPLIPAVTKLEKAVGLRRLVSVSPWIVGIAKRAAFVASSR